MPVSEDEFKELERERWHDFLLRKSCEKLRGMGYEVDTSSYKIQLAINKGGVSWENLEDVGEPDFIAVKDGEVIAGDVVVATTAREMAKKAKMYGKLGKVMFILPMESLDNIEFWSASELGTTLEGTRPT